MEQEDVRILARRGSVARVLVLTQYFPPETFTAARRMAALAAAIARTNPLTVSTLAPGYPRPSFYPPSAAAGVDAAVGHRVVRSRAFRRHTRSRTLRALREQAMALRIGLRAARVPGEVVVATSPSMFLGPVGWAIARVRGALFVWDLRDVTWEFAAESARRSSRPHVGLGLLRRCMWSIVRRADLVTAATPGIAELLVAKGIPADAIVVLPNQVPPDMVAALPAPAPPAAGRAPAVAYVGLLGQAQGLDVLVEAARELPGVRFVVAGDGPDRERLERRARELGAANLTFRGYVGRDEVLEIYRDSDILFSQVKDTPTLSTTAAPSKLLEYMAAGKPVIHAGRGLACRQLEEIGCGVLIPPDDPAALVASVERLVADRDRARALGARGRAWAVARANGAPPIAELVSALNRRREVDAADPLTFMAARMVAAALTAATALLVASSLGKSAYGTFASVTAIAGALVVGADLGLTSSVARFIAQRRADRGLVVRVIMVRAALAAGAAGLLAIYGLAAHAGTLIYLGGALVVANSFTALLGGLLPVLRSLRTLMLLTVAQPLLELAGVATVLALALGAEAVMGVLVAAAAVTAAVGVPIVVRRSPSSADVVSLRRVARYGAALAVVWVSMALFGVVDLLAIGYFHGSAAVAPYALALKLIAVIQLPGLAIAIAVAPRLADGGVASLRLFEGWLGALVAAYAGLVTIAGVLAPQAFAAIGARYRGDSSVFLALVPYALLAGIAPLASMGANFLGGARRRVRLALVTLAVNVALDLLLVPPLGAYGAAVATTVAFGWYVGGHLQLTYALLDGRPGLARALARVPRVCAAVVLAGVAARLVAASLDDRPWLALAVAGAGALAVYAVAARPRVPGAGGAP
jgi:colanic acid biosynthesis glycosyl transferase WcaI